MLALACLPPLSTKQAAVLAYFIPAVFLDKALSLSPVARSLTEKSRVKWQPRLTRSRASFDLRSPILRLQASAPLRSPSSSNRQQGSVGGTLIEASAGPGNNVIFGHL